MNHHNLAKQFSGPRINRRGVSLLEVIACTALVAILVVPVAGVIRASGQAIAQSDQDASTEAGLRRGLRWLSDAIRDGTVLSVGRNELRLTLNDGRDVRFAVTNGVLLMIDGRDQVVVADDVREIQFSEVNQATLPNSLIGIGISLRATDPGSRQPVIVNSMVSIPTQN